MDFSALNFRRRLLRFWLPSVASVHPFVRSSVHSASWWLKLAEVEYFGCCLDTLSRVEMDGITVDSFCGVCCFFFRSRRALACRSVCSHRTSKTSILASITTKCDICVSKQNVCRRTSCCPETLSVAYSRYVYMGTYVRMTLHGMWYVGDVTRETRLEFIFTSVHTLRRQSLVACLAILKTIK